MPNASLRVRPSPWPKMVTGYPLAGAAADGTLITNWMNGVAGCAGSKTPRGSVSRNTSTISPMYQAPTPVVGTGGGGIGEIQSGTDGTCVEAGGVNGTPWSWESWVTVVWVVNAHASATFVRGSPFRASWSNKIFRPERSGSSCRACASVSRLTVLWVPSNRGADDRTSANTGPAMTFLPVVSFRSVVM